METTTEQQYKPAMEDLVVIRSECARKTDHGKVYKVVAILKTNIDIEDITSAPCTPLRMKRVRLKPYMVEPAPRDAATAPPPPIATVVPYEPPIYHSTLVTVKPSPGWKQPASNVYVVLGTVKGDSDRYRIALLGGAEGFGYWKVHRSRLTPIDPARITVADADADADA